MLHKWSQYSRWDSPSLSTCLALALWTFSEYGHRSAAATWTQRPGWVSCHGRCEPWREISLGMFLKSVPCHSPQLHKMYRSALSPESGNSAILAGWPLVTFSLDSSFTSLRMAPRPCITCPSTHMLFFWPCLPLFSSSALLQPWWTPWCFSKTCQGCFCLPVLRWFFLLT